MKPAGRRPRGKVLLFVGVGHRSLLSRVPHLSPTPEHGAGLSGASSALTPPTPFANPFFIAPFSSPRSDLPGFWSGLREPPRGSDRRPAQLGELPDVALA